MAKISKISGNLFNKYGVSIDVIFGETVEISITKVHDIALRKPILLTAGTDMNYAKTVTLTDVMDNISVTNTTNKSTITSRLDGVNRRNVREDKIVIENNKDVLSIVCDKYHTTERISVYHNQMEEYIVIDSITTMIFGELDNDYYHEIIKISYGFTDGKIKFKTVKI